jgi:hypothetical protein
MSRVVIELNPKDSLCVVIVDKTTQEEVMTVRAMLIDSDHISADVSVSLGDHIDVRAWNNGDPLKTWEVNTQLQKHNIKTVCLQGINYGD